MPLTPEHKQKSRRKILNSAFYLFTNNGYDNVSIDEIMNHANMTRGGFYAHFSSKSDLYKEAILNAATNTKLAQEKPDNITSQEWIEKLLNGYLSQDHIDLKNAPCPLAFLSTDIAVREPEVRDTYTNVFKNMNKRISHHTKSFSNCEEHQIMALTALLIGGAAIGRALNDKETTEKLLEGCKKISHKILIET